MALARRYLLSAVAAVIITFGLFLGMQTLVAMGDASLDEDGKTTVIDFVRLRKDSNTQQKKRELPKRIKPQVKPPPPAMNLAKGGKSTGLGLTFSAPAASTAFRMRGGPSGGIQGDREEVPIVRVRPMYPRSAAERMIEGWVTVKFTINETGGVSSPVVIAAKPTRVFDRAAIQAIRKWKYKPKVVDGKPVARHGITVKLKFNLGAE